MKIKTKKQMNLPELIEHIVETSYECNKYIADNAKSSVYVGNIQGVVVEGTIFPTDTFTVEVEETVTEDTRLDKLVVRYRNDDIYIFPQERIDDFKNDSSIVAFYIPNDDYIMTLIWRDGKLVE